MPKTFGLLDVLWKIIVQLPASTGVFLNIFDYYHLTLHGWRADIFCILSCYRSARGTAPLQIPVYTPRLLRNLVASITRLVPSNLAKCWQSLRKTVPCPWTPLICVKKLRSRDLSMWTTLRWTCLWPTALLRLGCSAAPCAPSGRPTRTGSRTTTSPTPGRGLLFAASVPSPSIGSPAWRGISKSSILSCRSLFRAALLEVAPGSSGLHLLCNLNGLF